MRPARWIVPGLLALCVSGCGGGGGGGGNTGNNPVPVSVSVSPSGASIAPASVQTFTATVSGSANTAVTWGVQEGAAGGSIASNGQYTAPAFAGTYHISATSLADATKIGIVPIQVHVVVSVSPQVPTLTLNQTQTFSATVTGTSTQTVSWSVLEGATGGSIDASGHYTAPSLPGTYHVIAKSQVDLSQQGSTIVTVQAGSASGTIQ